ncbi:MAG: glycosyltransferase, partial [Actinotalea sp.]|nr:glycosyltransferase [Actinotalea sp.]
LVASTDEEAADLVRLYGADSDDVHVVAPGVDLELFHPDLGERDPAAPSRLLTTGQLDQARLRARRALGLPADDEVVLFAGRVQPLKAPDVLVRAVGALRARGGRVPRLVVLGGPSGNPTALSDLRALARDLGVADRVDFRPPVPRPQLARWYRAADLVAVPSRTESFGLVAAEAQACGTPVVAAAVGGLRTVVVDGVTGALVPGHDPRRWAAALADLLGDGVRRAALGVGAVHQARRLGWESAAEAVVGVYDACRRRTPSRASA